MQSVRIDIRHLTKVLIIWLIAPITVCIILDVILKLFPLLTLAASIIAIPVASVMVTRAALFEFNKIIQEVAPDEIEPDEAVADAIE